MKVSTNNRKMPGSTFATDPFACRTGSKLVDVAGSVCSKCYAIRAARYPNVLKSWQANQAALASRRNRWIFVAEMTAQILRAVLKTGEPYHRWFDAGDLPSVEALNNIVLVARNTPTIKHWVATREYKIVRKWLRQHPEGFPENLIVRVSSPMIEGYPLKGFDHTSTVNGIDVWSGRLCPASKRGNNCGDCRACWDKNVPNVSYPLH